MALSRSNRQNGYVGALPYAFVFELNNIYFFQGTYLGTVQDVNHLDLVGWINSARYGWARLRGRDIKFHPATFYLAMADHLARDVDGVQPESEPVEEDPWDASSDQDDDGGDR